MGFQHYGKHITKKLGRSGLNEKKNGDEGRRITKKRSSPISPFSIYSFFGNIVPYPKDDFHYKQFERYFVLLITKKLVHLSFVEAPFLR
jgi:hypothetical protein